MLFDQSFLEELGLSDTTERDLKTRDKVLVKCHSCGTELELVFGNVLNRFKKKGNGAQCNKCFGLLVSKQKTGKPGPKKVIRKDGWTLEKFKELTEEFWELCEYDLPLRSLQKVTCKCKTCQNPQTKTVKKFIEGLQTQTKGCTFCHANRTKSKSFSEERQGVAKKFMSNPENRKRKSEEVKKKWKEDGYREKFLSGLHSEEAKRKSTETRKGWLERSDEETKAKYEQKGRELYKEHGAKARHTIKEKYGSSPFNSEEVREKTRQTMMERYGVENPLQIPEVKRNVFSRNHDNKDHAMCRDFLTRNRIEFVERFFLNGKEWDFAIHEKGELVALLETDGDFFHGQTNDQFTKKQQSYVYDLTRPEKVPKGVVLITVDGTRLKEGLIDILEYLGTGIKEVYENMVQTCLSEPFPYPEYTEKRMRRDWLNLQRVSLEHFHKNILCGNSVITHFHKSIYHSNKKDRKSPVEAWKTPGLLEKCIKNRTFYIPFRNLTKYHIARGFERSMIAPRVSVFQPSLCRYLLLKYAPETKTCVDPFSGFSGRMLGACSLGMSYTGYEIRNECVEEARKVADFLEIGPNINNADSMSITDSANYDVLITCPPYSDKELWGGVGFYQESDQYIEESLKRFNADIYIFMVDKTEKYKEFVQEELSSKSHITASSEKVIVIHKNKKPEESSSG